VNFGEGDEVAAGQILFENDPRSYRAALQQNRMARCSATLAQAQSAAREARALQDPGRNEHGDAGGLRDQAVNRGRRAPPVVPLRFGSGVHCPV